jgi:hypothetical protein
LNTEGKLIKNPQTLADTLNNYFSKVVDQSVINITKQDHNQISQHSYLEYLVHESHQPFLTLNLKPVNEKEIYEIKRSLKWKNSCGYDEVPSRIVKLSRPFISSPLVYVCNKMLSTSTFPTRLTFSQVFRYLKKVTKRRYLLIDRYPFQHLCLESLRKLFIIDYFNTLTQII